MQPINQRNIYLCISIDNSVLAVNSLIMPKAAPCL